MRTRFDKWCIRYLAVMAGFLLLSHAALAQDQQREVGPIPSLAPMVEEITPAVVNISVTRTRQMPGGSRFFDERDLRRFFFGEPDEREQEREQEREPPTRRARGAGSGVIVDAGNGFIVTNHHVVAEADEVNVSLQDGRQFQAEVIGTDERTEIALLRIEADNLSDLPFADISDLRVGDYVVAVGNPFGIGQTVTAGIVSALGRAGINAENYEDFIQTDAAINVGNSGGALVDLEGRLVGINTAIISGSGTSAGVGFAVPVDMVAAVIEHLERDGVVRRGQLGVLIRDHTPAVEDTMQLGVEQGALVTQVMPDSAAERAGIQVSDVVVGINGSEVTSSRDLRNAVGLMRVDQEVTLELYRDGERQVIDAVIGGDGQQVAAVEEDDDTEDEGRNMDDVQFEGARLGDAGENGVEVLDVDQRSRAWAGGLRPGDRIVAVNRNEVNDLRQFNEAIDEVSGLVALGVMREGRQMLVVLP